MLSFIGFSRGYKFSKALESLNSMARVLVVEDDSFLAELICECLNLGAHDAMCAETGAEAMNLLGSEQFDVILLDWQLPDMEGIDILRKYREGSGSAKVVMLTGMRGKKDEILELGADRFLAKPFRVEQVLEVMAEITA